MKEVEKVIFYGVITALVGYGVNSYFANQKRESQTINRNNLRGTL